MTSSDQVARLLAMVPYLQSHDGVKVSQVAELFSITPAQVRRDLEVAYMCGLPGLLPGDLIEVDMDAVAGDGTIHLSNAEYLDRPLRLTADEALSLVLGLRMLREVGSGQSRAVIDSALARLGGLDATASDTAARIGTSVQSGPDEVVAAIETALAGGSRLTIRHEGRVMTTARDIDPARIVVRDAIAYLDAWDLLRQDWRTFRLDRIVEAAPNGSAEPHGEPPDHEAGWLERLGQRGDVVVRLQPSAHWVAEYFPVRSTERLPDGRLEVALPVSDPGWLDWLLLRLGSAAELVRPIDAAAGATDAAAVALEHYARLGVRPEGVR